MTRIQIPALLPLAGLLFCWIISPAIHIAAQGTDALVMVVNTAAPPASHLTLAEAKRLLLGQTTSWSNGSKVSVVIKPTGSKDRSAVLQNLCGMSEAEYTRFQMQLTYTGRPATMLQEAESASATKSLLKTNRGAVGFLHASEVDSSVKVLLALDLNISTPTDVSSQQPAFNESRTRAMMIVNLAKFIDWPPSRNDTHSSFIICAVGNKQVGADLESVLTGKTVQGRPVLLRRGAAMNQGTPCHILYVAHPRHGQIKDFAASLAKASVLTVSDEHQAYSGTIIGLPLVDGRVQLEINRPLAQASTLTLSSHLLQIATEGR